MTYECNKEEFLRDFTKEILKSSAALFIGSGLSRPAGYVGWKDILKEAAGDIGLDVEKESDLISLAEYYVNSKGRTKIDTTISEFFSKDFLPTENHILLASLPITSYWTTNYDQLLEKTFKQENLVYSVLTDDESYKKFIDRRGILLHKLHGDVDRPQETVITKKDYEEFPIKHEIILAKLKGEMCAKSFFFLGYSLSDTNIMHILSQIRLFYKDNPPKKHYCVMEYPKKTKSNYKYMMRKQQHHIEDLKSYGIHSILVNDFNEITDMLSDIRKRISAKNVFISGAFEEDANGYCAKYARTISEWLIQNDFKIFTGYGKNVGVEVVAGAFEGCKSFHDSVKKFNESVYLFPFPYNKTMDGEKRRKLYTHLRKNAILNTFITIVINGTKQEENNIINSPGVLEEIKISLEQGNIVIPLAITGGAASIVWDEMKDLDVDYVKTSEFQALKYGKSFEEVFESVKKLAMG